MSKEMTANRPHAKFVRAYQGERSLQTVANELGVAKFTVWRWVWGIQEPAYQYVALMLRNRPELFDLLLAMEPVNELVEATN
jgi:hypothetical protein